MISIRGAITVDSNNKEEILKETRNLLQQIIEKNDINKDEIISVIFTATKDLTKAYPAVAARELGIVDASLINMQEMFVEGSLEMCLRVLMNVNKDEMQKNSKHVYLKGAKVLRPDIS